MSTLQQLRAGLNEAWDTLAEGWQRLYRRASGAITRFTPGKHGGGEADLALHGTGWGVLAAEVFDNGDSIVVRLEVPGMNREDFELQVVGACLVVRGEKQARRERTQGHYRISECAYGRFERAIPLPAAVDAAGTEATYRRGVLRVELPRPAKSRRRTIKVDVQ
jgi:HSP20 family protein